MAGITETERSLREQIAVARAAQLEVLDSFGERRNKAEATDGPVVMTVEERAKFDQADDTIKSLTEDLERHMSFRRSEAAMQEYSDSRGMSRDSVQDEVEAGERAFSAYLRSGVAGVMQLEGEQRAFAQRSLRSAHDLKEDRNFGSPMMGWENRAGAALSTVAGAGIDGDAGFLIPQGFWHNLQVAQKQFGGMMRFFNEVRTSTGNPMPWPTTDPTGQLGRYITENVQLTGSDLIEFGQGMLYAWMLSSDVIKASFQIINDSAFDIDNFVRDRIAERIGRKIAAELHTGAGPAASALTGLSTSLAAYNAAFGRVNIAGATPALGGYYQPANAEKAYWFAVGTTATATLANAQISWQSILGMIGTVDPAYRASGRCVWIMNDQVQQNLRGLTDAFNRPLWETNVQVGPAEGPVARIQGFPVQIDQNAASVSTTPSTAGGLIFGDLQTAMVLRTVTQSGVLRLVERYADFLQVGYIGYERYDSQPNDLRAVAQYMSGAS